MTTLDAVIGEIKNGTLLPADPELMLISLKKLKEVIGHKRLKDDIASQVKLFIIKGKKRDRFLNICLYGPPGVGKSTVANILANIIGALKILDKPGKDDSKAEEGENYHAKVSTRGMDIFTISTLFTLIYMAGSVTFAFFMDKTTANFVSASVAIVSIVLLNYFGTPVGGPSSTSGNTANKTVTTTDGNMISAKREDIVGEFVGQTAPKTRDFLNANKGKVILWDEAYSLINGLNDPFGKEALNVINANMTERPNDNTHIFAGYREDIQRTIFAVQKGLPRRCNWCFDMDGYTMEDLVKIFTKQLDKDLSIQFTDKQAGLLFDEYKNYLKNYGGDTERLAGYIEILSMDDRKVDPVIIKQALEKLKQNYMSPEKISKSLPSFSDLLAMQ